MDERCLLLLARMADRVMVLHFSRIHSVISLSLRSFLMPSPRILPFSNRTPGCLRTMKGPPRFKTDGRLADDQLKLGLQELIGA